MRILFLDLDGTVRYSLHPSGFVNKPKHVAVFPEAAARIQEFAEAGWQIVFISNQGGIAAGFTTEQAFLNGVDRTKELLGFTGMPLVEYCHHDVHAGCICRKPLPGMVVRAIDTLSHSEDDPVDVSQCLFVGNCPEDEQCAAACGIPFMSAQDWRAGKCSPAPQDQALPKTRRAGVLRQGM